jgi:GNAT superfamily N-acetyltransferase
MEPLFRAHYEELATLKEKFHLGWNRKMYEQLDDAGSLIMLTCRSEGNLVGYYLGILMQHPHYSGTKVAFVDVFYLRPEFRKGTNGLEFMIAIEHECRARGAQVATMSTKLHKDVGMVLESLGWRETDRVYRKALD